MKKRLFYRNLFANTSILFRKSYIAKKNGSGFNKKGVKAKRHTTFGNIMTEGASFFRPTLLSLLRIN